MISNMPSTSVPFDWPCRVPASCVPCLTYRKGLRAGRGTIVWRTEDLGLWVGGFLKDIQLSHYQSFVFDWYFFWGGGRGVSIISKMFCTTIVFTSLFCQVNIQKILPSFNNEKFNITKVERTAILIQHSNGSSREIRQAKELRDIQIEKIK